MKLICKDQGKRLRSGLHCFAIHRKQSVAKVSMHVVCLYVGKPYVLYFLSPTHLARDATRGASRPRVWCCVLLSRTLAGARMVWSLLACVRLSIGAKVRLKCQRRASKLDSIVHGIRHSHVALIHDLRYSTMDVAAESPQRHHTHHRQRPQAAISPSRPVGGAPGPHRAKSPNRHHNQQRGAAEQRGRSRSPAKVHRTPSTHSGSASSVLSETNAHNEQRGRQHHGDVRSNTAASSPTKAKGKRSLSPLKRRKSHSKSMPAPESVQHAPAATNPRAIEEEFERMLVRRCSWTCWMMTHY